MFSSFLIIESLILCIIFTMFIYYLSKDPIKTLYNYPPNIQEKVRSLKKYKNKVPNKKDKLSKKLIACLVIIIILSLVIRFVHSYTTFIQGFYSSFILFTIVNLYDFIVLDVIWFCHDKRFIIKGTEDMTKDYHDYMFHFKGFLIGEVLGLIICALTGVVVTII